MRIAVVALGLLLDLFSLHLGRLDRLLENLRHPETLALAQRPTLRDSNLIAESEHKTIGIGEELLAHAVALGIGRMHPSTVHRDRHRVLHPGRGDDACLRTHGK